MGSVGERQSHAGKQYDSGSSPTIAASTSHLDEIGCAHREKRHQHRIYSKGGLWPEGWSPGAERIIDGDEKKERTRQASYFVGMLVSKRT